MAIRVKELPAPSNLGKLHHPKVVPDHVIKEGKDDGRFLFLRVEDLRKADFLDHLEAECVGSSLEVCLERDFLLTRSTKFRGEDGPARCDIRPHLSLDVAPQASHQVCQFLPVLSRYLRGGLEGIYENLG